MSASSIARAATDPDLIKRVTALAQKEMVFNEELADTQFGTLLQSNSIAITQLMWPIAVDTELAYETAVNSGRGAPGYDQDVIPDANLTSAIVAHWPYAEGEGPQPDPEPEP